MVSYLLAVNQTTSDITEVTSTATTPLLETTIVPGNEAHNSKTDPTGRIITPDPDLIGSWCVVSYENKVYPGIIQVKVTVD